MNQAKHRPGALSCLPALFHAPAHATLGPKQASSGWDVCVLPLPLDDAVCLHRTLDAIHWEDCQPVSDPSKTCTCCDNSTRKLRGLAVVLRCNGLLEDLEVAEVDCIGGSVAEDGGAQALDNKRRSTGASTKGSCRMLMLCHAWPCMYTYNNYAWQIGRLALGIPGRVPGSHCAGQFA